MKTLIAISLLLLTACGSNTHRVETVTQTQTVYQAPTPTTQDAINSVVNEVNNSRTKQGQLPLAPGLVCTLHVNLSNALTAFPTVLPTAIRTWTYVGDIAQADSNVSEGLNLIPSAIRSLYIQWFAVRCTGQLIVTTADDYSFSLRSDDASLLYLDGTAVGNIAVNNDGLHGPSTVTNGKFLIQGLHAFRLDYMQGPGGSQSLQLNVPAAYLYH